MRYALISDIHANLPALDAVLADIDARREIDAVCGPDPGARTGDRGGDARRD